MAARGAIAKETIINKILDCFDGAFINGKEVRIPTIENGNPIEIKLTLVAAKDLLGDSASLNTAEPPQPSSLISPTSEELTDFSEEEKQSIKNLLDSLGE